jgi:hypothetical protein
MCCSLTNAGMIGPFFFHEKTMTGALYLDMLENYAVPWVPGGYIFQQDEAPPQTPVTEFLNLFS